MRPIPGEYCSKGHKLVIEVIEIMICYMSRVSELSFIYKMVIKRRLCKQEKSLILQYRLLAKIP